jgi:hypothetical protein
MAENLLFTVKMLERLNQIGISVIIKKKLKQLLFDLYDDDIDYNYMSSILRRYNTLRNHYFNNFLFLKIPSRNNATPLWRTFNEYCKKRIDYIDKKLFCQYIVDEINKGYNYLNEKYQKLKVIENEKQIIQYKLNATQLITCECGAELTKSKLARHKFSLKHINSLNDLQECKEIIPKQKKKPNDLIICECGTEINRCNISRHKLSLKHINSLNSLNDLQECKENIEDI